MSNIGLSCTYSARGSEREHNGAKIFSKVALQFLKNSNATSEIIWLHCDEHELL